MILIVSNKKVYAAKRLAEEFQNQHFKFQILNINDLIKSNFNVSIQTYDALYVRSAYYKTSPKYIPHIIKLAKSFKRAGKKVVDANIANGNLGLGKWYDYQILKKNHLAFPKTERLSGKEFFKRNLKFPASNFQPLILKWIYGFGGSHTYFVKNPQELSQVASQYKKRELLRQEYIPAEFEYKVITVGYKSLPVVLRFRPQAQGFKIDLHRYAVVKAASVPKLVKLAEKAAKVLGRQLAKVDILEAKGKFYILEVNRSPSLLPFEPYSKLNVAGEFVKYLMT